MKDSSGELVKGGDTALEGKEDMALESFSSRRRIWKELQD
jgi:hypothetical protein